MKCFSSIDELASEIAGIRNASSRLHIGIDGKDGAGKSFLGEKIAAKIDGVLISLDNFLDRNQGAYLPNIDMKELSSRLETETQNVVVEGVCLLAVSEKIDIKFDAYIYVKKMSSNGYWEDEDICTPGDDVDAFIEKLNKELQRYLDWECILATNLRLTRFLESRNSKKK